jgi:cellulose synthase/poly-beta-1,6-N-acetylglucosamine synthase-like glycosyltransferase
MVILMLLGWSLTAAALGLLILSAILLAEVLASLLPKSRADRRSGRVGRITVLVPAHDEAAGIGATLERIKAALPPGAHILVVADNCSDATATLAAQSGAEVIARNDFTLRGKGYALDFGLRHMAATPPDTVIVVDADCTPAPGSLEAIGALALATGRPVQGLYLMEQPAGATSPFLKIALFAWRLKNELRPTGLANLGFACHLTGTGMAFPWSVISRTNLHTGNIVEDLALGLDCAVLGRAPIFYPAARFTSPFPVSTEAQQSQRSRWEAGHLKMIAGHVPRLFMRALASGNRDLLALTCDMAVPPLAFFAFASSGVALGSAVLALLGGATTALAVSLTAVFAFSTAIAIAWQRVGKDTLSLRDVALVPAYILSKAMLYFRVMAGRQFEWIRSRRD